jgi:predicted glycoside hydrolase/deacetylase ChbG (UPF0249 family)
MGFVERVCLMRVIVNADDFGYDADTVSATVALMRSGAVTSATIMANMPGSMEAIRFAARERGRGFGVHLTFAGSAGERPIGRASDCRTLLGEDGGFAAPRVVRLRALAGRIRVQHVVSEALAQLSFIADHGVSLSHVDTHHHLHTFEPFRSAIGQVLPRFGIKCVRSAQNVRALIQPWRPVRWTGRRTAAAIRSAFLTTDWFVMLDRGRPSAWWERCGTIFAAGGSLEFGCHPGAVESWRRLEHESVVGFADWCARRGVHRTDWRSIGA